MQHMHREIEQISQQPNGSAAWATEFGTDFSGQPAMMHGDLVQRSIQGGFDTGEFARFQHNASHSTRQGQDHNLQVTTPVSLSQNDQLLRQRQYHYSLGMRAGVPAMPVYRQGLQIAGPSMVHPSMVGKQAGGDSERLQELNDTDWEAQFAQMDASQSDADMQANAAVEAELNTIDRSVPSESNEFGDFESIWRGIQAEKADNRQFAGAEDVDSDMTLNAMHRWDGFDSLNTHDALQDLAPGEYLFEEENIFKDVHDPYGEGMRIMEEGGNLSLAALAFEAAVQKDPQHVEAWAKLGAAQAQNEKESPAIRALEQALKLDPSNLEALMGLAVSYINEGYDSTAYRTLERWLATKYSDLVPGPLSSAADVGFTERQILHDRVTRLFIKAAQRSPTGEAMDPDVQVGLGVLFYGAEEYDKAVDCFGAALASTESGTTNQSSQLHLLWNRLGATLANSRRSEEAIEAYEQALQLRPNFVRARYNLGVSCINIGCFHQAAEHLLGALAMHKVDEVEGLERARKIVGEGVDDVELNRLVQQNQSTNLYETLRRAFSLMERRDLVDVVGSGMELEQFRKEFDF